MKRIESITKLREICQKPVIHLNTYYAKNFARTFSIYFTKLFLYTNISANIVTMLMLITGIIASIFFCFGQYWYSIIAVLLLQFWYILDHVDGEIARYRKTSSVKGIFMDLLNHHIVHPMIFVGIGIGLYIRLLDYKILLIITGIVFCLLLQDLINLDRKEAKENINKKLKTDKKNESVSIQKGFFNTITKIFYKFPGIMNIITLGAIFNQLYLVFLFYGITFPIMIIIKLVHNLRVSVDKF